MIFSSPEFLFAFLPITLVGYWLMARWLGQAASTAWLVLASLFFYGWWNPRYVVLIVVLILVNCALGNLLLAIVDARIRRLLLIGGVSINLMVLGYYKYAEFIVDNVNAAAGTSFHIGDILLPLGISFFTFQKIAFLVDVYRGIVTRIRFLDFSLFVLFFPQLIAGPIVHHREIVPQLSSPERRQLRADDVAIGLSVLLVGLFKKVVLADNLSAYVVTPVFALAASGAELTFLEAWGGVLGYTLQLYFDFSGYCDMAVGAARMFGIRLPQNFNSPYKAINIIDFWRRWHMTLGRFLRDYLYIPLGGNARGEARRYVNLFITMLLGGVWHGAGWTFVIWGMLHGAYLMVNHGWQAWRRSRKITAGRHGRLGALAASALTFLAVVVGWVFFRADSLHTAMHMLGTMFAPVSIAAPNPAGIGALLQNLTGGLVAVDQEPYGSLRSAIPFAVIAVLLAWCWLLPNTQQIFSRFSVMLNADERTSAPRWLQFQYGAGSAVLGLAALVICVLYMQSNLAQEFLYFDF